MMRLVIDASAGLSLATSRRGFGGLAGHQLVAPALFWSEATSSLRESVFRHTMSANLGGQALAAILTAPIERVADPEQYDRAWLLAARLGWAKTYDAEYLAVAQLRDLPLLTRDGRLMRGAAGLVRVIQPDELGTD